MRKRLALMLVLAGPVAFGAEIEVENLKDTRTTQDSFFGGLEVELKIDDDDGLEKVKALRAVVDTAADDTGRKLVDPKKVEKDFDEVSEYNRGKITLKLRNPARKAQAIAKLEGKIQLFEPSRDPKARVAVPLGGKAAAKPAADPALAASKIELTVLTAKQYEEGRKMEAEARKKELEKAKKNAAEELGGAMVEAFAGLFDAFSQVGENDLVMQVHDPEQKIVGFEVETKDGKTLKRQGSSTMGDTSERHTRVLSFGEPLPESSKLIVHVATSKALVEVPFKLENVKLP